MSDNLENFAVSKWMPEMLNSEKQIYLVLIGHWYVNMGLGNMDNMGNCPLINSLPGQFSRRSYFGSKSSCKQ